MDSFHHPGFAFKREPGFCFGQYWLCEFDVMTVCGAVAQACGWARCRRCWRAWCVAGRWVCFPILMRGNPGAPRQGSAALGFMTQLRWSWRWGGRHAWQASRFRCEPVSSRAVVECVAQASSDAAAFAGCRKFFILSLLSGLRKRRRA